MNNKKNSKSPLVTVIVVTFNGEKYISDCINAILESNYSPLEIIIVDNCSSDNTVNQIKTFENKVILITSKTNLGFAGGNNLGIKNSHGDIVVLVNQDAILTKNSILELILPILNDEKIMITGPKIFYPDTRKIQSAGGILHDNGLTDHIGYGKPDSDEFNHPKEVDYVTGAVMAIHKKLFEKTGLFSEVYKPAYYEELEKCVQASKLHYKILYIPTSEAYHYESTTFDALSTSFLKHYHTNRFRFIYRNYSFFKFISKFIPSELFWFFSKCPPKERNLVAKCHLRAFFSH